MPTSEQINAAVQVVRAVADAIKELKQVPSGEFYARVMGHLSLAHYESIINTLKKAELVKEEAHLLTWIGGE